MVSLLDSSYERAPRLQLAESAFKIYSWDSTAAARQVLTPRVDKLDNLT